MRLNLSRASASIPICFLKLGTIPIPNGLDLQGSQGYKSTSFDLTRPSGSVPWLGVYTISFLNQGPVRTSSSPVSPSVWDTHVVSKAVQTVELDQMM